LAFNSSKLVSFWREKEKEGGDLEPRKMKKEENPLRLIKKKKIHREKNVNKKLNT